MTETVALAALRRYVVAHQGYATRPRNARTADVADEVRRLSCVQLDSIATVDRAHRLTLGSRLGRFPQHSVTRLLETGRLFEYWAHEACLLAIEDYPLFKRRMADLRDRHWWGRRHDHDPEVKERVLGALRERGPLPARFIEGGGGGGVGSTEPPWSAGAGSAGTGAGSSTMWNWKPEKRILEDLFAAGEVVVAGRDGFQRLYALPETVIPRRYLDAPTPTEDEFVRGYALRAVEGRGALTEAGIAEHCRFRGGAKRMRPVVDALVADGLVRRVAVDDDGPPVVVPADADLEADEPRAGVLLCPFDNLLWDKPFVERVFGFQPLIEVYKRGHERLYGYYVLPFLLGDRLVGRVDLKSDRAEGVLQVKAFHLEPGVRRTRRLGEAFERAAHRLARSTGLERVAHSDGDGRRARAVTVSSP